MSERDEKIQYLLALQEKARRARSAPLLHYAPHPGQARAHAACRDSRIVLVTCGNRWGKSHMNAAEAVGRAYGYRIWEVPNLQLTPDGDYPPRSEVPREYWYVRPDGVPCRHPARIRVVTGLGLLEGIGSVMWPKIEEALTPACRTHPDFSVRRGAFGVPIIVKLPNGSSLHFNSSEQSPMQFEGSDFTHCLLDEPPAQGIWAPIWRGLTDQLGTVLITATPIGPAAPWLYDKMVMGDLAAMTTNVHGSIWENPHVPDHAKREFLDGGGFTEEERAARESGAWVALSFRAFPMFDPDVHVVPPTGWHEVPPGWPVACICDPAHRRPYAFMWMAFEPRPDGQILVFDEHPRGADHASMRSSEMTVPDYANMLRTSEGQWAGRVKARVLDPRFGKAKPRIKGEVHTSIQEDFVAEGFYFDCQFEGTESEETGIERIRAALRFDRSAPISVLNRPRLRVAANCINTINALQLSNFVPPSARDPENLPEKLNEKYKDFRDCLRYGILYPFIPMDGAEDGWSYLSDRDFEAANHAEDWWDI